MKTMNNNNRYYIIVSNALLGATDSKANVLYDSLAKVIVMDREQSISARPLGECQDMRSLAGAVVAYLLGVQTKVTSMRTYEKCLLGVNYPIGQTLMVDGGRKMKGHKAVILGNEIKTYNGVNYNGYEYTITTEYYKVYSAEVNKYGTIDSKYVVRECNIKSDKVQECLTNAIATSDNPTYLVELMKYATYEVDILDDWRWERYAEVINQILTAMVKRYINQVTHIPANAVSVDKSGMDTKKRNATRLANIRKELLDWAKEVKPEGSEEEWNKLVEQVVNKKYLYLVE